MNILVLGSTGFIGAAAVARFVARGHKVTALSRSAPAVHLDPVNYVNGDIEDTAQLRALVETASHIFYAAGATTPGSSSTQPALEVSANLLPLMNLLDIIQRIDCPKTLIYLSSAGALYADDGGSSACESQFASPNSYYGAGKLAMEHFIEATVKQSQCRAVVLRPTNAYGPGQHPKQGFGVVPALFHASKHQTPFQVWGDGSLKRDFIYIDDLLDLCDKLLLPQHPLADYSVLDVCSGKTVSIRDLIELINDITGNPVEVINRESRACDYSHPVISTEPAADKLGWHPTTALQEGLKLTWQWYLEASE